jgi:hypothetical protein
VQNEAKSRIDALGDVTSTGFVQDKVLDPFALHHWCIGA